MCGVWTGVHVAADRAVGYSRDPEAFRESDYILRFRVTFGSSSMSNIPDVIVALPEPTLAQREMIDARRFLIYQIRSWYSYGQICYEQKPTGLDPVEVMQSCMRAEQRARSRS